MYIAHYKKVHIHYECRWLFNLLYYLKLYIYIYIYVSVYVYVNVYFIIWKIIKDFKVRQTVTTIAVRNLEKYIICYLTNFHCIFYFLKN